MTPSEPSYTSPVRYTRRQRVALAAGSRALAWTLKGLCVTCRFQTQHPERLERVTRDGGHVLIAIWHETLALAAWCYRGRGYHTLTSYSFDGELAACVLRRFGLCAVRGSSSRGGSDALRQLEKAARLTPVVGFTLDGPRGPRRIAKPGLAILAARTGLPIVPHAFAADRCRRMNSWDRLILPKPFARVTTRFGEPIAPPASTAPDVVEAKRLEIETALNELHASLETEPESGGAPE